MTYRVEWAPRARKQVDELSGNIAGRVFAAVGELAAEPRPHGCTKLTGEEAWRIRIGDYRVIYEIHDRRLLVLVVRVAHRREVYR